MRWVDSLPDDIVTTDLVDAAYWLVEAVGDIGDDRMIPPACAGAIIRNHRKALGKSRRRSDFSDSVSDEQLIWGALAAVALVGKGSLVPGAHLRTAEAALRTLWRRGQS